jgi:signal transduction histidine kinase
MEGEYIDKFNEKGIELVTNICEEPVMINADGRHLFRITENVLTNAFKYSKENTKVNMTLTYDEDNAIMTLENVCAQKIEVSEDELIERFVRGDRSRSTEGSGLGLSISKSLTELMNGEFLIEVTGEMFKVILKFPLIKKNTEGQNDE